MNKIYETKANYVFDFLKEKILTGKIKQGENIVISKIAEELNISTIPVREALKRLQSEGLIDIIPHKGAQVTIFDINKVNEVMIIRAILEGYAARTVVGHINEKVIEDLKQLNNNIKEFAELGDDENFSNSNKEFHRLLYKQSPYPMLYNMIFNLWDGGNWSKSIFAYFPKKMQESVEEHFEILKAIEDRDELKVEMLTREHKFKNIEYYKEIANRRQKI